MKCLSGYALKPSFHDPAYTVAMRIAYQEINQLQFAINRNIDTALRFKLNFDVDRSPEAARTKELHALIQKLEEAAQKSKVEKNSSKILEQVSHGDKGKGKKLVDSLPSPISEEEE